MSVLSAGAALGERFLLRRIVLAVAALAMVGTLSRTQGFASSLSRSSGSRDQPRRFRASEPRGHARGALSASRGPADRRVGIRVCALTVLLLAPSFSR